ncbi:neuroendocrine convertase 1-like [Palaemon carinicauda]|uniref:neuroendocrine convertase 1-like n=1 Tax=Palaemon carinicauda TaxID=392227 RepID=UPI0035B66B3A
MALPSTAKIVLTFPLILTVFLLPGTFGQAHEVQDIGRYSDGQPKVEGYEEVKEKLRKIFDEGVEQDPEDGFNPSSKRDFLPLRRRQLESFYTAGRRDSLGRGLNPSRGSENRRHGHSGHEDTKGFLNEWIIHLTGGEEIAASVARDLGYEFLGQVGDFRDVYRLVKRDHPTVHKRAAPELTHELNVHVEVKWAEQLFVKERSKRAMLPQTNLVDDAYDPYAPLIRVKRREFGDETPMREGGKRTERSAMSAHALELERMFNDELWVHQWYLFDTRTRSDLPKLDLQVVPVWKSGVTGKGVKLLVLDDGLEWNHEDIEQNYDASISYDFNDNDEDPSPRYDEHFSNSHGTRCVGEIAMAPNNRKCGVGVAYGASVGGIRMLDGPVSDVIEGLSLGWPVGKADIISCSWGPTDDGRRVEGPGRLADIALRKGVTEGRDGKGIVYVWAAGNGGSAGDDCNCDGYTSSIYTLSISSASETGLFPWYGERCASTLAAAYSSGAYTDQKIATTDLRNSCTDKFSGTSAAAPLAAGIFALALEVNPELTWRDMQHAVVWSSEWAPLGHNSGWLTNGKGLKFNSRFGFGLLNADGLVRLVGNWTRVPEKAICTVSKTSRESKTIKTGESVILEFTTDGCEGTEDEVRSLEHVQVIANIDYTRRGALSISLTSPSGTRTVLLNERVDDDSEKGFHNWPLMSVHTWGEDPRGTWILNITDLTSRDESGSVGEMELLLHGTKGVPVHLRQEKSYRIPFKEDVNIGEEEEHIDLSGGLTAEALRTLPWNKLVQLLQQRTKSTFSNDDVELLLSESSLEKAVRNLHSDRDFGFEEERDLNLLVKEVLSRK